MKHDACRWAKVWYVEASDGGGACMYHSSSHAPMGFGRESLICWSQLSSTPWVRLNFPTCHEPVNGPLRFFRNYLVHGPKAHQELNNHPPDLGGTLYCPLFQSLFWYTSIFNADRLRLNIHNWTMDYVLNCQFCMKKFHHLSYWYQAVEG